MIISKFIYERVGPVVEKGEDIEEDREYAILQKEEAKALLQFLNNEWLNRHNELGLEVVRKLQEFVKD